MPPNHSFFFFFTIYIKKKKKKKYPFLSLSCCLFEGLIDRCIDGVKTELMQHWPIDENENGKNVQKPAERLKRKGYL